MQHQNNNVGVSDNGVPSTTARYFQEHYILRHRLMWYSNFEARVTKARSLFNT